MSAQRNPFRLRAAENIQSENDFLRLFGPRMLEVLPDTDEWHKLTIFQSSPGGGKTTLFRLFQPNALKQLVSASRADEDLDDLRKRLEGLGFVDGDGPNVLGVFLSCDRNFATLDDLGLETPESIRLFNALLNARITLSTLRSGAEFYSIEYPQELDRLQINPPPDLESLPELNRLDDGADLFQWAQNTEQAVCQALDSFDIDPQINTSGHQNLHSLSLLEPGVIRYQGRDASPRSLLMLDDAHRLTDTQREHLFDAITNYRANVRTWVSQRLIALKPREAILGATEGREYEGIVNIEDFWYKHTTQFQRLIEEIGDRRTQNAATVDITSFRGQLDTSLDNNTWASEFEEAQSTVEQRVRHKTQDTEKFDEWIRETEANSTDTWDIAIDWRALEIKIERQISNEQQMLDVGVPLADNVLETASDTDIQNASEKLLCEEFELPYYYGPKNIAYLSSFNIDQYLSIAGDLFEEIASRHLLDHHDPLPPGKQDEIIREWANRKWDEIPRNVPRGEEVQRFLGEIGRMCRDKWEEGTASYGGAGALTGIGLRYPELKKIVGDEEEYDPGRYALSREVLMSCLVNNLLEARPHRKQGRKDQEVLLLYLNRWICVKFDLPLLYGGWRQKNARDIQKEITAGTVV